MTRKKLTVHRKAYHRKAYVKSSGIHVKAAHVPSATFKVADIGAVGRGKKLFKVKKGLLTRFGYHTALPIEARRTALRKADRKYGTVRLWRMLNAQVLFRKRFADGSKETFLEDRNWVRANLLNPTEARSMTRPAVRKWESMPHYRRVLARAGI
jgi:hypothetical protein